jgi:hypothetical protein
MVWTPTTACRGATSSIRSRPPQAPGHALPPLPPVRNRNRNRLPRPHPLRLRLHHPLPPLTHQRAALRLHRIALLTIRPPRVLPLHLRRGMQPSLALQPLRHPRPPSTIFSISFPHSASKPRSPSPSSSNSLSIIQTRGPSHKRTTTTYPIMHLVLRRMPHTTDRGDPRLRPRPALASRHRGRCRRGPPRRPPPVRLLLPVEGEGEAVAVVPTISRRCGR